VAADGVVVVKDFVSVDGVDNVNEIYVNEMMLMGLQCLLD